MLPRRAFAAASAGLAASVIVGKPGRAQAEDNGLPEAGPALHQIMPTVAPDLRFTDASGKPLSLLDFRGHGLVVNLWATWCGPCVSEMPSLAAVASRLARQQILVLPVSIDMQGRQAVARFFASHHITGLPILLDPDGGVLDRLNADGIPLTLVINPAGQLVARLEGEADWNTPATLHVLGQLAGRSPPQPAGVTPAGDR